MAAQTDLAPDPWQVACLRSRERRELWLCARQTGKSTVSALVALHEAIYSPASDPALVLLLSTSLRQSSELFRKVMAAYRRMGSPVGLRQESVLSLETSHGARIVSLPGSDDSSIRGYSGPSLVIIDEASRVPDELYYAIRPMLAVSGGRLIALSTPWGQRGWFYHEHEHGGDVWRRVKYTARECPRISQEFLAQERASMPDSWFRSEYLCEFTQREGTAFDMELVDAMVDETLSPLFLEEG